MAIEGQTEAQRRWMNKALRLFEGRAFIQPVGGAPRFLTHPSAHQLILELTSNYQARLMDRPEIRKQMEEVNREIISLLMKFRDLLALGYVEPPGFGAGVFEGVLEAQYTRFNSILTAGHEEVTSLQRVSANGRPQSVPKKKSVGRHRDTMKPVLAAHCRFMLECFGIQPASGPSGNVATLAKAVHFLATGQIASMERAAALALRPARLADHLGMWRLTE